MVCIASEVFMPIALVRIVSFLRIVMTTGGYQAIVKPDGTRSDILGNLGPLHSCDGYCKTLMALLASRQTRRLARKAIPQLA